MNKYMRAILRAVSYPDIDVKKHYMLVRQATRVSHRPLPQREYRAALLSVAGPAGDVPVRLFHPANDQSEKLIVFAHGGGWVAGDVDSYSRVCQTTADETGYSVLSVDYRLAPENPFPAGLMDYYAVVKAVFTGALLAYKADNIVLMGDSAGGNLTAALCLMARDRGEFHPAKQILIYPACASDHNPASAPYNSLRENGEGYLLTTKRVCEYMELYRASPDDMHNPYCAPLAAADLSGQPDTLILTAQYDPLRDEGEAYGARLLTEGNRAVVRRIPDALHGFFSLPASFAHVRQSFRHINDFLNGVTG